MSPRRLIAVLGILVASAVAALTLAAGASAEAGVEHLSFRDPFVGSFYNICDLEQGPDSPMFTASGFAEQQLTLVLVDDLHVHVTMQSVTHLNGTYPDGRHVVFNATFLQSATVDVDPISLETGELVLASALTATVVQHGVINVQGKDGAPDENYDAVSHLTYTPDLRLASLKVEFRGGCK
jgi:hypothetical protein